MLTTALPLLTRLVHNNVACDTLKKELLRHIENRNYNNNIYRNRECKLFVMKKIAQLRNYSSLVLL